MLFRSEKGAEIGAHILSGNVFEPRALTELFPDWQERGAPLDTPVINDSFYWLPNGKRAVPIPGQVLHLAQHCGRKAITSSL